MKIHPVACSEEQETNSNLKYYHQVVQNNYAEKGDKNNNASLKTLGEVQPIITISCGKNTMQNIHADESKQLLKKPKSKSRDIELTVLNSDDSDEKDTSSQKKLILNEDLSETELSFVDSHSFSDSHLSLERISNCSDGVISNHHSDNSTVDNTFLMTTDICGNTYPRQTPSPTVIRVTPCVEDSASNGASHVSTSPTPSADEEHNQFLTTSNEESNVCQESDTSSVTSKFRGSLGIECDFGSWNSRVDSVMDIRMGRDEWHTEISGITGDISKTGWQTKFCEIEASSVDQWDTTLNAIEESLPADWSTTIADGFNNKDANWDTIINKIEKVNQASISWNTHLHKAQKVEGRWDTVLNPIDKNRKGEWKFKLPDKFKKNILPNEWKSSLNTMSACSKGKWDFKYAKVDVNVNDKGSHWNTAFHKIQDREKNTERWTTRLNTVAPVGEKNRWNVHFAERIDDFRRTEDWNVKLIEIQKNVKVDGDWSLEMNDTPDSYHEKNDWATKIQKIDKVNPEENRWVYKEHRILPRSNDDTWSNSFYETDLSDMSRMTWQTQFCDIISNTSVADDWDIRFNPIDGSID